jgi:hypothetical protein
MLSLERAVRVIVGKHASSCLTFLHPHILCLLSLAVCFAT